jgi:hypothetical protein
MKEGKGEERERKRERKEKTQRSPLLDMLPPPTKVVG